VGLKLGTACQDWAIEGVQQSHHCGIETINKSVKFGSRRLQQSHHCGIETRNDLFACHLLQQRSNRTIVGLKQLEFASFASSFYAAIAPLWD